LARIVEVFTNKHSLWYSIAMLRVTSDGEYSGRDQDVVDVYRAARYAGYAGAMVANLYMSGSTAHAELWEAEQTVWLERKDTVIQEAPLGGRWLHGFADEVIQATFDTNAITHAQLLEATTQP
jgi:hypothetical protein